MISDPGKHCSEELALALQSIALQWMREDVGRNRHRRRHYWSLAVHRAQQAWRSRLDRRAWRTWPRSLSRRGGHAGGLPARNAIGLAAIGYSECSNVSGIRSR